MTPPHDDSIMAALIAADRSLSWRPITCHDQVFCREMFAADRRAMFAPLGLPPAMLSALLDHQWAAQHLGFADRYPDAEHLLIIRCEVAVGRLIAARRAHRDGLRALVVVDILISQTARNAGIGTAVLRSLEAAALAQGASQIELSVLASNAGARRLYQRLGYLEGDGDAHLPLVKPLTAAPASASAAASRASPA